MMSSISLFDIISAAVLLDPQIFLCIPASATVNPNGIKAFLANGLITFFINGSPVFNNGPRILPKNPPDCIIVDKLVFGSLISVDKLFVKFL